MSESTMPRFNIHSPPITHPTPIPSRRSRSNKSLSQTLRPIKPKSKSKSKKKNFKNKKNNKQTPSRHFTIASMCKHETETGECSVIRKSTQNDTLSSLKCTSCINEWDVGEEKWECVHKKCQNTFCLRCIKKDTKLIKNRDKTHSPPTRGIRRPQSLLLKNKTRKSRFEDSESEEEEDYVKPTPTPTPTPTPMDSSSDSSDEESMIVESNHKINERLSKINQYTYSPNRKKAAMASKQTVKEKDASINDKIENNNNHNDKKCKKRSFCDINKGLNDMERAKKRIKGNDGNIIENFINRKNKMDEAKNKYITFLEMEVDKLRVNGKKLYKENADLRTAGKKAVSEIKELREKLGKMYAFFENVEGEKQANENNNNSEEKQQCENDNNDIVIVNEEKSKNDNRPLQRKKKSKNDNVIDIKDEDVTCNNNSNSTNSTNSTSCIPFRVNVNAKNQEIVDLCSSDDET